MEEYVKQFLNLNGKSSIEDLTDEEVLSFYVDSDWIKDNNILAKEIKCYGKVVSLFWDNQRFNKAEALKSMRIALKKRKRFKCCLLMAEGIAGSDGIVKEDTWIFEPTE